MRKTGALVVLVLASAAVAGVALALSPGTAAFSVQYVRTGGFAGANDILTIDDMGRVAYSSRFGQAFNASLSQPELASLKGVLATNLGSIQTTTIHPRSGAADFFSYDLNVTINGKTTHLSWVDGWAAQEPLPPELQTIQQSLQATIQAQSA